MQPRKTGSEAAGDGLAALPPLEPNGACNRCNAPVAWVRTAHGKNLPLDPDPSRSPLAGNFGLQQDGVAIFVRDSARMAAFPTGSTRSEFPIYVAHFATCPGR
jgi:hypothetical protein